MSLEPRQVQSLQDTFTHATISYAHHPTVAIATPIARKSTKTADMMVNIVCHTLLLNLHICKKRLSLRSEDYYVQANLHHDRHRACRRVAEHLRNTVCAGCRSHEQAAYDNICWIIPCPMVFGLFVVRCVSISARNKTIQASLLIILLIMVFPKQQ